MCQEVGNENNNLLKTEIIQILEALIDSGPASYMRRVAENTK